MLCNFFQSEVGKHSSNICQVEKSTTNNSMKYETARCDEIFAYKRFVGVTTSRDAAWRALLTCQ